MRPPRRRRQRSTRAAPNLRSPRRLCPILQAHRLREASRKAFRAASAAGEAEAAEAKAAEEAEAAEEGWGRAVDRFAQASGCGGRALAALGLPRAARAALLRRHLGLAGDAQPRFATALRGAFDGFEVTKKKDNGLGWLRGDTGAAVSWALTRGAPRWPLPMSIEACLQFNHRRARFALSPAAASPTYYARHSPAPSLRP